MLDVTNELRNGYVSLFGFALAYISPGVGVLLLQLVLIAIATGFLGLKSCWRAIKSFVVDRKWRSLLRGSS